MLSILSVLLFFFNAGGPSAFYTLSLHVALPIWLSVEELERLQAALQHPLRFVLQRGDVAHDRSEEHTSELQSRGHLVCRLRLEKNKSGLQGASRRVSWRWHRKCT